MESLLSGQTVISLTWLLGDLGARETLSMPIYCLNCKSNNMEELVIENEVFYLCRECQSKSGRALIVNGKIKIINTRRGIKHISVGAIIIRSGKMLLTHRRTYPFGLEIPVGHLEYDETLEQALEREIYEEVGLKVEGATLLTQIEHPISHCRYGSSIEEWAVFAVECRNGRDFVSNHEIESLNWLSLSELDRPDLTPSTRFVLEVLNFLPRREKAKSYG